MNGDRNIDLPGTATTPSAEECRPGVVRINSEELFAQQREVEIEHQGRIYRLRLTSLNKLILTA